jgi:hypothetical protein
MKHENTLDFIENGFFDVKTLKLELEAIKKKHDYPEDEESLSSYLADWFIVGEYSIPQIKQLVRELDIEPCAKLSKILKGFDEIGAKSRFEILSFERLENTDNGNAMFSIKCEVLRAGDAHRLYVTTGLPVTLFSVPDSMENCAISESLISGQLIRANVSRYASRVRVHDVQFERAFDICPEAARRKMLD